MKDWYDVLLVVYLALGIVTFVRILSFLESLRRWLQSPAPEESPKGTRCRGN